MGVEMNKKVDVYLEFKNDKQFGLGVPLPAGRLRVSQLDKADGSLEFIGEDTIDHTPKDEQVRVKLGSASTWSASAARSASASTTRRSGWKRKSK
jgi:hypothetical protein